MTKYDALSAKEDPEEKKIDYCSRVLEGLSDDAFKIAQDIGRPELTKHDGIVKLVEAIRKHVRATAPEEAKILYREGSKKDGLLSRQPTESIMSYLSRRNRWHTRTENLDEGLKVPGRLRTEMMLESSRLSEDQRRMILTTTKGVLRTDRGVRGDA